jgi:hypothetical protein
METAMRFLEVRRLVAGSRVVSLAALISLGYTPTVAASSDGAASGLPANVVILPLSEGPHLSATADYFWTPEVSEVPAAEAALALYMNLPDVQKPRAPLNDYIRQYIGIRRNGEVLIHINLALKKDVEFDQETERKIRGKSSDWHSKAIVVTDGGDAFWRIDYDPRTKQLKNARFNGVA